MTINKLKLSFSNNILRIFSFFISIFLIFTFSIIPVFAEESNTNQSATSQAPSWLIGWNDFDKQETLDLFQKQYGGRLPPTPDPSFFQNDFEPICRWEYEDTCEIIEDYEKTTSFEEHFSGNLEFEKNFKKKYRYLFSFYYTSPNGSLNTITRLFITSEPLYISSDNSAKNIIAARMGTFIFEAEIRVKSTLHVDNYTRSFIVDENRSGGLGYLNRMDLSDLPAVIVHNGSSPIFTESGQEVVGLNISQNTPSPSNDFNRQSTLGIYSKYKTIDYPKATPLSKFDGFYTTPDKAFNDSSVKKNGLESDYFQFYFKDGRPIIPNAQRTAVITFFNKRYYSYHLYYFVSSPVDDGSWRKKSVWSSSPLIFEPSPSGGEYKTPKMKLRPKSIAIVVDYGENENENEMSVLYASSILSSPPITSDVIQYLTNYYINDYDEVKKDTSERNGDTITLVPDGSGNDSLVDGSGNDVTDDKDEVWGPDGVIPPSSNPDSGILGWFKWLFDSISNFFKTLTDGIKDMINSCGDFFSFLGQAFSFIPAPIWTVLTVGVSGFVLMRFLGR